MISRPSQYGEFGCWCNHMNSLKTGYIEKQIVSQALLRTIRLIGECKGREELYKTQAPQILETLRQAAIIQSVESSNRIEGVEATPERIRELVQKKTAPRNRSEREIAGYRDVLNTIHADYDGMVLTSGLVLQLHRDLYQFDPSEGGKWKPADNTIEEAHPDGTKVVRFHPVPAFKTPEVMEEMHRRFSILWDAGEIEPLLLIPSYILDFLCIHPFRDGNGRMARLLTLLLLYKAGYEVGRFISLELIVEKTRETYYEALYNSSQGWHECKHSLGPWWAYFLGVVVQGAYSEFEDRVGLVTTGRGSKSALVKDTLNRLPGEFSVRIVQDRCPNVGIDLIRRILKEEKAEGRLECIGRGPGARWRRIGTIPIN